MTDPLTARLLIPVASEEDARDTIEALEKRIEPTDSTLTFVHVIEKGEGAPDKAPLQARKDQAEAIFDLIRSSLDERFELETSLSFQGSVVEGIEEVAATTNPTAIVFAPRPGGKLTKLLSGNLTRRLISIDEYPVVVLPGPDS